MSVVAQPTRGVPPFVYAVTQQGKSVLAEHEVAVPHYRDRLRFSRHRHLVNDFYVTLVEACRKSDCRILDWRHEESLRLLGGNGFGGPERLTIREPGRPSQSVPFLPDGFFQLDDGRGSRYAFFVEIDLATHPLRVWRQRARLYTAYDRDGLFQQRFGRETFRLLIVTTPDYRRRSRRDNILGAIRREVGDCDMFLATTFADFNSTTAFGRIWRFPGGSNPCSILPQVNVRMHPVSRTRPDGVPRVVAAS